MEPETKQEKNKLSIPMAIIVVGVLVAGAILLKGGKPTLPTNAPANDNNPVIVGSPAPVGPNDMTLGNGNAKVTLIMYEDFQCPWCGKFVTEAEQTIRDKYVKDGSVQLVYRDFPFLGEFVKPYVEKNDESIHAAEAASCAKDQGKFWEFHDYLYTHQNGENQGNFSNINLKSFAKNLGLDTATFNQCLDGNKYAQAVTDSKAEGIKAGVQSTPKGFILVNGKVVSTIDGYLPSSEVTQKIDAVLK